MRFQSRLCLLWVVVAFQAAGPVAFAQQRLIQPPRPGFPPTKIPSYPVPKVGPRSSGPVLSPKTLPKEALGRLGSVEFRLEQYVQRITPSGDGKTVAVTTNSGTALVEVATGKQLRRIPVYSSSSSDLSPDGKKYAVGGYNQVQIYDTKTGKQLRYFRPKVRTSSYWSTIEFSPNSNLILAAPGQYNQGNTIYVWDVNNGKEITTIQVLQDYQPRGIFSHDGKTILSWGTFQNRPTQPPVTLQLWNIQTGKEIRRIETDTVTVTTAAFSPDGKELALINGTSTLSLYDVKTGKLKKRLAARQGLGSFLKYSPDGRYLAAAGNNGDIQIWDRKKNVRVLTKRGPMCYQSGVIFRKDGKIFGFGRNQQVLCVWDALTGKTFTPLEGHHNAVSALAFGPKGKTLRSVDQYGYICFWDVKTRKQLRRMQVDLETAYPNGYRPGHNSNFFQNPAFSTNGKFLAATNNYNTRTVQFWDVETNRMLYDFDATSRSSSNQPALSADGTRVACFLYPGMVSVWNTKSGEEVTRFKIVEKIFNRWNGGVQSGQMSFSPDNNKLAIAWNQYDGLTGRSTSSVAVWDLVKRKELFQMDRSSSYNLAPAFSTDGQLVVLATARGQLALYDANTGNKVRDLDGSSASYPNVLFSPDGRFVIATSYTSSSSTGYRSYIYVWETATGKRRTMFTGHRGMVSSAAFSADGRTLATGSYDTTILFWDMTGQRRYGGASKNVLTKTDIERLTNILKEDNASNVAEAIGTLVAHPQLALAYLKKTLQPAKGSQITDKDILRWIDELDSDRYKIRETATLKLKKLGTQALEHLQAKLAKATSQELKRRITKLVREAKRPAVTPARLASMRGVEILEWIGNDEARELLVDLAKGAPGAPLTRDAKGALSRLQLRAASQAS